MVAERVPEVVVLPEVGPRWVDGLAEAVARAAEVLEAGGSVVLPTDTVYGVAALASVPGAAGRLFAAKERGADHPLAVLVADVDQALPLLASPPAVAREAMDRHWPGPLTLVLRRSPEALGLDLGGDPATIGVRCPDHAFVRALAARVGPIATTSANRTGEATPSTAREAAAGLAVAPDLVVDGGPAGAVASTVVDATEQPWQVLRVGALSESDLLSDS
ncbi:MAG: threonylcarbamoyl-AMP synthase [Actinobacteria bacterium]|nr:threonylcarbamoyl-AMP synthase [Actinomycetota bacterium]